MRLLNTLILIIILQSCSATSVKVQDAQLGQASDMDSIISSLDKPGTIVFEKHLAANWQVPLSGLLNLKHPKAVAAGLVDIDESIQVFVYTLQHPSYGTFLIDSGISERFNNTNGNSDVSFLMSRVMNTAALDIALTTKELLNKVGKLSGVFLTHIHFDHIMGLTDIDSSVPVYIGSGDASTSSLTHVATQGTSNRLLKNVEYLQELHYSDTGIIDVFNDGSLWAIHSPGHTSGTTAYLAITTDGPQLLIGDVTHTRWGWDNSVEPGSYSMDTELNAVSLQKLKALVDNHPHITAHPGHQN
jgi:glyoxylase-like metal-dependent hydrolase (beta-lactamase superfamily II)